MSARGGAGGRLSALDGSFLRLESAQAHMHVGWTAVFAAPADRPRPTVRALRERVTARLDEVEWCRWRLQGAPLSLSEPSWAVDRHFDLAAHVVALGEPEERVSYETFAALRDEVLSEPLDRSRPLWQIFLIPRLEDGRVGMIGKVHHALVDGIAALQIVGLVVDDTPDAVSDIRTSSPAAVRRGPLDWALDRAARTVERVSGPAVDGLALFKATAAGAARPYASARAAVRDAGRVLQSAREDLLPRAPDSTLNAPIGARRTLVGYHAPRAALRRARGGGGTVNDIGLTVVAGALRALALRRGEEPRAPLKAMVPVSMRRGGEIGPGNQISMVYIQLPINLASPDERLEWVRAETQHLKGSHRAENMQTLYAAGGLLPVPLRSLVTRAMASPRVFNLTVSQSPGPRGAVYMLGGELQEVYSVVPISAGHALAIGMVRYRQELFIGCYADPDALPEVRDLPALLEDEMRTLGGAAMAPHDPQGRSQAQHALA
jgi:diacylglycerol O-acyltransferase / wax synthase